MFSKSGKSIENWISKWAPVATPSCFAGSKPKAPAEASLGSLPSFPFDVTNRSYLLPPAASPTQWPHRDGVVFCAVFSRCPLPAAWTSTHPAPRHLPPETIRRARRAGTPYGTYPTRGLPDCPLGIRVGNRQNADCP